jgi:hypothetical protein
MNLWYRGNNSTLQNLSCIKAFWIERRSQECFLIYGESFDESIRVVGEFNSKEEAVKEIDSIYDLLTKK